MQSYIMLLYTGGMQMSQFDKLIQNLKHMDNKLRFEELKKILQHIGYKGKKPRSGSSHWTFRKERHEPITVPEKYPIKIAYILMVKQAFEIWELENEERKKKEEGS